MSGGLLGGFNTYAHVNGQPTMFTDPEGLRNVLPQGTIYRGTGDINGQIWIGNQMRDGAIQSSEARRDNATNLFGQGNELPPRPGNPVCRQVCPDGGGKCEAMPKLGLPSGGGCYTVCDSLSIGPR